MDKPSSRLPFLKTDPGFVRNSQLRICEEGGFSVRLPEKGWTVRPSVAREEGGTRFTWLGQGGMQWLSVLHRTRGDWTDISVYIPAEDSFDTIWESVPESADDGFVAMCGAEEMASWTGSVEFSGRVCRVFVVVLRRGTESWAVEYGFPAFSFDGGPAGAEIDESDSATAGLVLGTFRCGAKEKGCHAAAASCGLTGYYPSGAARVAKPQYRDIETDSAFARGWRLWNCWRGRASRGEFWGFAAANFAVTVALVIIGLVAHFPWLAPVYSLFLTIPQLSLFVRRWHDMGLPAVFPAVQYVALQFMLFASPFDAVSPDASASTAVAVFDAFKYAFIATLFFSAMVPGSSERNRFDDPGMPEQPAVPRSALRKGVFLLAVFILSLSLFAISGVRSASRERRRIEMIRREKEAIREEWQRLSGGKNHDGGLSLPTSGSRRFSGVPLRMDSAPGKVKDAGESNGKTIRVFHRNILFPVDILVPVPEGYRHVKPGSQEDVELGKRDSGLLGNKDRFLPKGCTVAEFDEYAEILPGTVYESNFLDGTGKTRMSQKDFREFKLKKASELSDMEHVELAAVFGGEALAPDNRDGILLHCQMHKLSAGRNPQPKRGFIAAARAFILVDGHIFLIARFARCRDAAAAKSAVDGGKAFLVRWAKDIAAANDRDRE